MPFGVVAAFFFLVAAVIQPRRPADVRLDPSYQVAAVIKKAILREKQASGADQAGHGTSPQKPSHNPFAPDGPFSKMASSGRHRTGPGRRQVGVHLFGMSTILTGIVVRDIRFPTSREHIG